MTRTRPQKRTRPNTTTPQAGRLGVPAAADRSEMVAGLFGLLRGRGRWLLVYDNAEQPDRLADLPAQHHVGNQVSGLAAPLREGWTVPQPRIPADPVADETKPRSPACQLG